MHHLRDREAVPGRGGVYPSALRCHRRAEAESPEFTLRRSGFHLVELKFWFLSLIDGRDDVMMMQQAAPVVLNECLQTSWRTRVRK